MSITLEQAQAVVAAGAAKAYPQTQPGGSLYGLAASNDGKVITFPGGIPLKDGETIVGAVGVSGGTVDQDQQVAEAAVGGLF